MLKKYLIKRKLSLIQEDLGRLSDLKQFSFDQISQDFVKQAAVERLLERVVPAL